MIASSKTIFTVFWGIRGMMLVNWLRQGAPSKGEYFNQEILQPLAAEPQGEGRPKHRPWTLLHMDNAKPHTSKSNLVIIEELYIKRTAHSVFSLILHIRTSFSLAG
jgi:hypothetical protein